MFVIGVPQDRGSTSHVTPVPNAPDRAVHHQRASTGDDPHWSTNQQLSPSFTMLPADEQLPDTNKDAVKSMIDDFADLKAEAEEHPESDEEEEEEEAVAGPSSTDAGKKKKKKKKKSKAAKAVQQLK